MAGSKSTTAGKKVAAKKAAVTAAKTQGAARRKVAAQNRKLKVTPASQWKSSKKTGGLELEVPSGNVALVRPVGIEAFLSKGLIPNSLREIALEAIKGKKAPEMKMDDLNEEQLSNMMQLFDDVTVYCVIEPEVAAAPLWTEEDVEAGLCDESAVGEKVPFDQREEGPLYVDIVDLEDKMFIFQFACGGTRNVESFRAELASGMERLSGEQDVAADA